MFVSRYFRWRGDLTRAALCVLSLVLLACWMAAPTAGQAAPDDPPAAAAAPKTYRTLPVDEGQSRKRNLVMQTLRNGFGNPLAEKDFDRFYNTYFLSRWSLPENRAALAGYRGELQIHFRNAQNDAVHDHLNTLVQKAMAFMARSHAGEPGGDFHPATRVNAMLMIGELNADEKVPVPLPEALEQVLVPMVSDAKQLEAVRVAAMVGILRHAKLGGIRDADVRRQVGAALERVAQAKPAAGQDTTGNAWLRAQAAEILGMLGSAGNGAAVLRTLVTTVADSKLPLATRSIAAEALGKLNYQGVSGLNPSALAAAVAQFAVDACYAERKRSSRRHLQSHLNAAAAGLSGHPDTPGRNGLASLATADPHRTFVGTLVRSIKGMTDAVNNSRASNNEVFTQVNREAANLEAELQKLKATP